MLCTDWARVDRNSAKEFCGWARAAMRFGAMRKSQRLGAGGQGIPSAGWRAAVRFRAHSVHGWVGAAKRFRAAKESYTYRYSRTAFGPACMLATHCQLCDAGAGVSNSTSVYTQHARC